MTTESLALIIFLALFAQVAGFGLIGLYRRRKQRQGAG